MRAFMKVLVQDTKTHLYLGQASSWTSDLNCAVNFEHTLRAFDFLGVTQIKNARIVMKFQDDQYDILLNAPTRRISSFPRAYPSF
jgi:hypothetical protein